MNGQHGNPREGAVNTATLAAAPPAALDAKGLVDRCLGNLEFVETVLRKYQERFPQDVSQLRSIAASGDASQLVKTAHRLKGAAVTVGATGLSTVLAEIEALGRANQLPQLPECLDRLEPEWQRFREEVIDLLGQARDG
jgi:HPt (histidine-containing phosphotransfer) domain-containing protein